VRRRALSLAGALLAWSSALAQTPDAPRSLMPKADPSAIQSEPLAPPEDAAPPASPAFATPSDASIAPATPETTMTPPKPDAAPPPPAPATAGAPTPPPAAAQALLLSPDWQPRQTARLQALDKHDLRVAEIEIPVGQSGHFGALAISVRACLARPPDQALDAAALLDITDQRQEAAGFSGWMFAAEPALAILENPIYDIRVRACH
jgi:hypothetical protein